MYIKKIIDSFFSILPSAASELVVDVLFDLALEFSVVSSSDLRLRFWLPFFFFSPSSSTSSISSSSSSSIISSSAGAGGFFWAEATEVGLLVYRGNKKYNLK